MVIKRSEAFVKNLFGLEIEKLEARLERVLVESDVRVSLGMGSNMNLVKERNKLVKAFEVR